MLKKFLREGARKGSCVGFILGAMYGFVASLFSAFNYWRGFADTLFYYSLGLAIIAIGSMLAALVGGLTGIIFGIIFQKFRNNQAAYILNCVLFCVLFAAFINYLLLPSPYASAPIQYIEYNYTTEDLARELYPLLIKFYLWIVLVPSLLYIVTGVCSSFYLFNEFRIMELESGIVDE